MSTRAWKAVLLDVDGTLVDSNGAHARAWAEACRERGHDVTYDTVRPLIGMGGELLLERLLGLEPDDEESRAIRDLRERIFLERHLDAVRGFPGARELVARIRESGRAIVVASSSSRATLAPMLEKAGLSSLLPDATGADDADEPKPEPDILLAAARRVNVEPSEAVLVGDTPYDLEAAARLGMDVVAVRSGGWSDADLTDAVAIYEDVGELVRRWDESPFARPIA